MTSISPRIKNHRTHQTHCCVLHGCKYGNSECPVVLKQLKQEYLCEECDWEGISDIEYLELITSLKHIIVAYWIPGSSIEKTVGIPHHTTYDYTNKKRDDIVNLVLGKRLQIMMNTHKDTLIIWIDNGRFGQR
jgi:hypothetical protein